MGDHGNQRFTQMAAGRLTFVVLGLLAVAALAVVEEDHSVTELGEDKMRVSAAPNVRMSEKDEDKADKIMSFKQLRRMISRTISGPQKAAEKEAEGVASPTSTADVQEEKQAIGNTLKNMEAKTAVKEELEAETPVDCEMGAWGGYSRCSKSCGGGKKTKKRSILRRSRHGGMKCGKTTRTVKCNMKSCAAVEEENYEVSRKLTKQEQNRERAQNAELVNTAMEAEDTNTMWSSIQEVMRALVKTDTVVIKPPNSDMDPEKYELEQTLKKAMAKNAMSNAMAKVNVPAAPEPTTEEIQQRPRK